MTVLAADIGGSSVKAALVSSAGAVVAQAALPAPTPDADGMIAPADWWTAFRDAATTLRRDDASAFAAVAAITFTGVTRTPVILDADANPLIGAMPARDARAGAIAAHARIDPQDCAEAAHYDAFHPAARLKWVSTTRPDVIGKAAAVVDPKDFIAARLTGRVASDTIASARLSAATDAARGPSLLSRLGLPERLVPDLLAPCSAIAPVRAGVDAPFAELAGQPVVMASHDTWCGVVGLGALVPGRAYNISGTTETFGVLSRAPAKVEGLIDLQWGQDLHQLGGPGQNGADVLAWLGELFGPDAPAQITRALAQPRIEPPLLFLPYLSGERVPFWDADLRGAFLGLSRQHGRADLVRAVLEGISFLNAIVLSRAENATGITVDEVRFGGGGARIAEWAQIKADIVARPVVTVASQEAGVLGAALAAFVALGTHDTLARAQQCMVRVAQRFEPRVANRDFYRALGLVFGEAHDAVRPISHALSKVSAPQ